MAELSHRKRSRDDSLGVEAESFSAKRLREDLLSLLDDSDTVLDRDSSGLDLDSVIRSFEAEISGSSPSTRPGSPKSDNFVDLTSDSGDFLPDLGQLLGYDDIGGSAPDSAVDGVEFLRVASESSEIGEFSSYDSFGYGLGYVEISNGHLGDGDEDEYVELDGIFDYSDDVFGSDFTWRSETLPAL